MTPEPKPLAPVFTDPSDAVTQARTAIARLQRHLSHAVGPLDASADLSSLAFATLSLESIRPPYPPLAPDPAPAGDLRADLDDAIEALLRASSEAVSARETLRFAYVIRELRDLETSPYLALGPDASAHRL